MGDGKFGDPVVSQFARRMREAAALTTATALLLALVWGTIRICRARLRGAWRWVIPSLFAFVGLNLWINFAAGTCLLAFALEREERHTQPCRSSDQAPADQGAAGTFENRLAGSKPDAGPGRHENVEHGLAPEAFVTGPAIPGKTARSTFACYSDNLQKTPVNLVVCYVSELNLFRVRTRAGGPLGIPGYATCRCSCDGAASWSATRRTSPMVWLGSDRAIVSHTRTSIRPCARCASVESSAERRDAALPPRLEDRSTMPPRNTRTEASRHLNSQLSRVRHPLRARRSRVGGVLWAIESNAGGEAGPALSHQDASGIAGYRERVHARDPCLSRKLCPRKTASDYDDLTHVNQAARRGFTKVLAGMLTGRSVAPGSGNSGL